MSGLHAALREEVRDIPPVIALQGDAAMVQLARHLLQEHAPEVVIERTGVPVEVLCREEYCVRVLASFLEGTQPPGRALLHTLPEADLITYARERGIAVATHPHSSLRTMLERIAAEQPQTWQSIVRSAQRLRTELDALRESGRKPLKDDGADAHDA